MKGDNCVCKLNLESISEFVEWIFPTKDSFNGLNLSGLAAEKSCRIILLTARVYCQIRNLQILDCMGQHQGRE